MDATDLRAGFRLGPWLVEPRESRLSGPTGSRVLDPVHMEILLCLVENHGEAVDRRALRERAWPGRTESDQLLLAGIRALRDALGESPRDQSCIVTVARGGFALIAHFEPPREVSAISSVLRQTAGLQARRPLIGRLQSLIVELRRRSVFKVAGTYLVGIWVVLQVAETTFEPLLFPDWWMRALTILAIVGLPIVAALAWSYEITPGGIVLDDGVPEGVKLPRARRAVAPAIVAGVALMAAVTGVAWWRSIDVAVTDEPQPVDSAHPSVAVLPLVDMSPSGGSTYLGDGLSEELSMRLAQIPGLRVAARTSAFEFKGRNLDVRRIGQALGVRHVLEGSVRRDGDNLRVTVQLIDAASGYHVWAGSYDRGWSDVIAIQDDIARSVTDALRVVLAPRSGASRESPQGFDLRAFDPYLAGLAALRQSGDMSRLNEAAARFREALAIAPSFARAHAGLCEVGLKRFDRTRDPADLASAEAACRAALALDPALVETEKALASVYVSSGRHAAAQDIFRAVVARNPRDADGHIGLARSLAGDGREEEAEASFRDAIAAEPSYWGAHNALGSFLFEHGRAAEAIEQFRRVTELTPASSSAFNNLGAALQYSGDMSAAAGAFRRSLEIEPSRSAYSNLGTVHYYQGEFAQAVAQYTKATALAGQDQALWGNLADAQWQIPHLREDAVRNYRRAITLAERDLEAGPERASLVAQIGYYYGRVGEYDRADRLLKRARDHGVDDLYVQYIVALSAADRGDASATLTALGEAIRLGFPVALVRRAPEFGFLATDAEFRRLTSEES